MKKKIYLKHYLIVIHLVIDKINTMAHPFEKKKTFLISFFSLFLISLGSLNAQGIDKVRVNLNSRQQSVLDALKTLEKDSGIKMCYYEGLLEKETQKLNISEKNITVREALNRILANTSMQYKETPNCITIERITKKTEQEKPTKGAGKIHGFIKDQLNEPLIGATVKIQKTQNATLTDTDGQYTLNNLEEGKYILEVSYIGYKKKTQNISLYPGERKNIDIVLDSDNELNEVVITALGIKREEKALGYSVTKLSNEDVTGAMTQNWSNALAGKVAGLNLIKSGGGPIGTNRIVLRGENSLDGAGEALIVVDGVILNAASGRMTAMGSSAYNTGGETTVDFGTGISDINPDDIEDITVLKGPGAAALYGERGSNGAIMITTKKGTRKKGVGVTVNSNIDIETINRWPDYQYEYGQGGSGEDTWYSYNQSEDGASTRSTSSAWGPKFNGQMYYQYDPVTQTKGATRTAWVPYKNNRKDFFDTGVTYTNNVSIDGGSKDLGVRLSYTNKTNNWIVPNTGYKRNTVALSVNYNVTPKLRIDAKVNYTNNNSDNLPTVGYGRQSIMYFIRGLVPNADLAWMKNYWKNGQEQEAINRPFSSLIDNPYAITYEMLNASDKHQVVGNVSATYNFTKNLSLMVRSSLDYSYNNREQRRPKDTQYYRDGMYRTQAIYTQERNSDFLLKYDWAKNDFKISASFGGSRMHYDYNKNEVRADQLLYPGIYTFANSKLVPTTYPYREERAVNSFYGLFTFNYKYLYLDITARKDWSSALATPTSTDNCDYFYPSLNLSTIISEAIKLPSQISYLKLRGSIAGTGDGGQKPYRTAYSYTSVSDFNSGLSTPSYIANKDLKNMDILSYEAGIDIALFKDRFRLDVTAYQNDASDQIVQSNLDRSTGYNYAVLNAGKIRNKGIEVGIKGKIIDQPKDGFKWSVYGTYALNRNKLISLTSDMDIYAIHNSARGSLIAYTGGTLGAMYGLGYKRAPEGTFVENSDGTKTDVSGKIVYDSKGYAQWSDSTMYIGDVNPKWKGSIGTTLGYKGFSLSILLDGQFGGVGYSLTHAVLAEEGKLKKTLPGRYSGIIGDGVILNTDGSYRINDVVATDVAAYYQSHYDRSNVEANTFKTDYIKLREARLDYTIPRRFLSKFKIQKCVVGIYGRDLFVITKWPSFDPEFGELTGTGVISGFEVAQFPSTRTIGANITLAF